MTPLRTPPAVAHCAGDSMAGMAPGVDPRAHPFALPRGAGPNMIPAGREPVVTTSRRSRPFLAILVVLTVLASLLPQGVVGQSPDPDTSSTSTTGAAPQSDPSPDPDPSSAPEPGPDDVRQAAGAPFPFSWRNPTKGTPTTNVLTAGGIKTIRFSLGGEPGPRHPGRGVPQVPAIRLHDRRPHPGQPVSRRVRSVLVGLRYTAGSRVYSYRLADTRGVEQPVPRVPAAPHGRHDPSREVQDPDLPVPAADPAAQRDQQRRWRARPCRSGSTWARAPARRSSATPSSPGPRASTAPRTQRLGSWSRTNPHGLAGLTRNAAKHDYRYAWKTSASWVGTCRRFEMRLKDGTVQALRYRFGRRRSRCDDDGTGFATDQDTAFTTGDVLANDSDPDGDPHQRHGPRHRPAPMASVSDNGDGTFDYDPDGAVRLPRLGRAGHRHLPLHHQ